MATPFGYGIRRFAARPQTDRKSGAHARPPAGRVNGPAARRPQPPRTLGRCPPSSTSRRTSSRESTTRRACARPAGAGDRRRPEGHDPAGRGGHQPVPRRRAGCRCVASSTHCARDPRFAGARRRRRAGPPRSRSRKMLVKVKREIIRMDHPTIRPDAGRAPAVAPATLRRWLDAGPRRRRAARSCCSTRATPSRSTTARSRARSTGASSGSPSFRMPLAAHRAELAGQDGRQLLHRRHPLREGRAVPARRGGRRVPARWRHPRVLRAGRRRSLDAASASSSTSARR